MRSRYVNEKYRRDTSDKAIAWAMEEISYDHYGRCDAYMLEDAVILMVPPDGSGECGGTYAWKLDSLISMWLKRDLIDDDDFLVFDALVEADLLTPAFSGEPTLE